MILVICLIRQFFVIGLNEMVRTDAQISLNKSVRSLATVSQNREFPATSTIASETLTSARFPPEFSVFRFLRRLLPPSAAHQADPQRMLRSFEDHRQDLQEEFLTAAAGSGKPRGLRWTRCDWLEDYVLVREAESGMLTLFLGVNVSFEAVEGGDMEGVEAVSTIRDGSAVFHALQGRWGSGGRVLFNMDPLTASQIAASGQEILAQSSAAE